jgi:hypothetical protein
MSFEDVRLQLAEDIRDDSSWQTFAYPPAVPMANSVVIEPGSPWVIPNGTLSRGIQINLIIKMYANAADNQNDLRTLEHMVNKILGNLPGYLTLSEVSLPIILDTTTSVLTTCDIQVSLYAALETD